jgi:hypothetical protein
MPVRIRDTDMRIVRASLNLRGILLHSRYNVVSRLDVYRNKDDSGQLGIVWTNGDHCITDFASHVVLCRWIKRPLFAGAEVVHHEYPGERA